MKIQKALRVIKRIRNEFVANIYFRELPPVGTILEINNNKYQVVGYNLSLKKANVEDLYEEGNYEILVTTLGGCLH